MFSRTKSRNSDESDSTRSDASTRGDEHGGTRSLSNGPFASDRLTARHNRPPTMATAEAYRKHAAKPATSTLFDKAPAEARKLRRASHPAECVGVWDMANAPANGSMRRSAGQRGVRRSQSAGPARPVRPARTAPGSARPRRCRQRSSARRRTGSTRRTRRPETPGRTRSRRTQWGIGP